MPAKIKPQTAIIAVGAIGCTMQMTAGSKSLR